MLSGYRTEEGLWRIPLKKNVQNINTDTLLIQIPSKNETIPHVFEIPSTEKTITYHLEAAVLFTKETCTDANLAGNYDTWPGLNIKSVKKYFP